MQFAKVLEQNRKWTPHTELFHSFAGRDEVAQLRFLESCRKSPLRFLARFSR